MNTSPTSYEQAVRLFPEAEHIRLEYDLAMLLYPNATVTYDENGCYWKMHDLSIKTGPNFLGYVPKWLRSDADAFQLMITSNCAPFMVHHAEFSGYRAVHANTEEDIDAEVEENTLAGKSKAARIAIVKAAIFKEKLLKTKCEAML